MAQHTVAPHERQSAERHVFARSLDTLRDRLTQVPLKRCIAESCKDGRAAELKLQAIRQVALIIEERVGHIALAHHTIAPYERQSAERHVVTCSPDELRDAFTQMPLKHCWKR